MLIGALLSSRARVPLPRHERDALGRDPGRLEAARGQPTLPDVRAGFSAVLAAAVAD